MGTDKYFFSGKSIFRSTIINDVFRREVHIDNILLQMILILLPILSLHLLFSRSLRIVASAQITNGITVTFKFPGIFNPLAYSRYLPIFFFFFTQLSARMTKSMRVLFFLLIITGRLVVWSGLGYLFLSQNPRKYSGINSDLCIYHLSV